MHVHYLIQSKSTPFHITPKVQARPNEKSMLCSHRQVLYASPIRAFLGRAAVVPRNEGTIAGDFWCIAFDERRLRPRLPRHVTGLSLAGALLTELVIHGRAEVTGAGEIYPLNVQPPSDRVLDALFRQLWEHRDEQDLSTWIRYLALTAYDDVATRLVAEGIVGQAKAGGMVAGFKRLMGSEGQPVYIPESGPQLAWPAVRVANMLRGDPGEAVNVKDLVCSGLAVATGLIDHILWDPDMHAPARQALPRLLAQIPPALAMILARTESAVGDAVLTNRT
jgi:hypothetical protein